MKRTHILNRNELRRVAGGGFISFVDDDPRSEFEIGYRKPPKFTSLKVTSKGLEFHYSSEFIPT